MPSAKIKKEQVFKIKLSYKLNSKVYKWRNIEKYSIN